MGVSIKSSSIRNAAKGGDNIFERHPQDKQQGVQCKMVLVVNMFVFWFLAHMSRRLIGELIVYKGIRRPSVVRRPSVRQHFQTTSPLKPRSRSFHISHIASIRRGNE